MGLSWLGSPKEIQTRLNIRYSHLLVFSTLKVLSGLQQRITPSTSTSTSASSSLSFINFGVRLWTLRYGTVRLQNDLQPFCCFITGEEIFLVVFGTFKWTEKNVQIGIGIWTIPYIFTQQQKKFIFVCFILGGGIRITSIRFFQLHMVETRYLIYIKYE